MLIDSHCHLDQLDFSPYQGDFSAFVQATVQAGVETMLCVSITLADYPLMLNLIRPYAQIYASVGQHPNEPLSLSTLQLFQRLMDLGQAAKVVAIGETGLDYCRPWVSPERQQACFRSHIQAAIALGKPLIVHTREAREDTIRILKEEGASQVGGVLHCFTETYEMAKEALDLNFYISFSGIITFKNAAYLRDIVEKIPIERILIETDAPYLAPMPYRGKPNEPKWVRYVAQQIATLRGISYDTVAKITTDNFLQLFMKEKNKA